MDFLSWFGLVNQVGHYNRLFLWMLQFKSLLSSKSKFTWISQLYADFHKFEITIVNAIKKGEDIFNISLCTCLRLDWSYTGDGCFLLQKHCHCNSSSPDCCFNIWKITLVGSLFLKPAKIRYTPVEAETIAVAWTLEQERCLEQQTTHIY